MLNDIFLYFTGFVSITINKNDRARCVVAFYKSRIAVSDIKDRADETIFYFSNNVAEKALLLLREESVELLGERRRGLYHFLSRYRNRPGLFLGLTLLFLTMLISGRFLWCIKITGNESVDDEQILEILEEHGVYLGAYYPSLDLHSIYNDILIDCDELCWISINIRGTVASVEVRESNAPKKQTPIKGKYANIIAGYDGEITRINTYCGNKVVSVGDVVKKGELLISGVYENKMGETDIVYSLGEVFATVRHEFSVEVPLYYEKKSYTGRKNEKISIKIFTKSINILNNSRNSVITYDIIEKMERVYLSEDIVLPISFELVDMLEYTMTECQRSEAQAEKIAYERANRQILSLANDGDVISKEYQGYLDDGRFVLNVVVFVNTNIAKIQEFVYNEG